MNSKSSVIETIFALLALGWFCIGFAMAAFLLQKF